MNCGKAIAQGSHASNAFVKHFDNHMQIKSVENMDKDEQDALGELHKAFYQWENETDQGFGTVLVLEGNYGDIKYSVDIAKEMGYISAMVFDPTYPIVDGEVVHHIPLETCGYVFVPDKDTKNLKTLSFFNLHH